MSKQYLTVATHDSVHPTPIFSLTSTPTHLLSTSGSSTILTHSLSSSSLPPTAPLTSSSSSTSVHKLGAHHITSSLSGTRAVSVGFGGEVLVWSCNLPPSDASAEEQASAPWTFTAQLTASLLKPNNNKEYKPGECWAVALSSDGSYLAGTTIDGRVHIWDLTPTEAKDWVLWRTYETKGSFGLCVDISSNDDLTVSGHQNGGVYVFSNESGRLKHSLPSLGRAVRCVKFSPAGSLVAAAGDARVIGVYDARHGEQVMALSGHGGWIMSLDWSSSGEYIVSGDYAGKVRIWRTETGECVSVMQMEEAEGAVWSVRWVKGRRGPEGFVVGTERGGLRFLREAAGG